jgi:hypothetical protein
MRNDTIKVVEGKAHHDDVSFSWAITLYKAAEGWLPMRGSLKCPKEHRLWMYDSGYLQNILMQWQG